MEEVQFRIAIPARYASQRLPGKPLRRIHGRSMIEWVYRAAQQSEASEIVVATDDQRILDVVESFARMGDNDLLATYEVEIGPSGEMQTCFFFCAPGILIRTLFGSVSYTIRGGGFVLLLLPTELRNDKEDDIPPKLLSFLLSIAY